MMYIIASKEVPCFKIGFSDAPDLRLKGLQTAFPYDLYILLVKTREIYTHSCEKVFHKAFINYQARGEWYTVNNDTVWLVRRLVGKTNKSFQFNHKNKFSPSYQKVRTRLGISHETVPMVANILNGWFTAFDSNQASDHIKLTYEQWFTLTKQQAFGLSSCENNHAYKRKLKEEVIKSDRYINN